MPAVSKAQRRYMGMCSHCGKEGCPGNCPKGMDKKDMREFAKTSESGLPARASKEDRRDLENGYRKRKYR
jgi:hypothetical protein